MPQRSKNVTTFYSFDAGDGNVAEMLVHNLRRWSSFYNAFSLYTLLAHLIGLQLWNKLKTKRDINQADFKIVDL